MHLNFLVFLKPFFSSPHSHTNFRPIVRDGYVWEKAAALETGLSITPSRSRPREVTSGTGGGSAQEVFLEYMQLHDFAATDAYARITSYDHISPCDRTLNIHLQKLAPQKANSMVLTFYNYREVGGATWDELGVHLEKGAIKAKVLIGYCHLHPCYSIFDAF